MSREAERRYKKRAMRTLSVTLHKEIFADVLAWWDKQDNKRQAIVELIRKEINGK